MRVARPSGSIRCARIARPPSPIGWSPFARPLDAIRSNTVVPREFDTMLLFDAHP
jgi:hypothetical protein